MQPTITSSCFRKGGFTCYCKMAVPSLTLILCADWAYNCLPLVRTHSDSGSLEADKTEKKLIGKVKVIIDISCGSVTLALVTKVQKAAKHWQIFQVRCPRSKLQVYQRKCRTSQARYPNGLKLSKCLRTDSNTESV